ncbi:MAG TPA: hypothetical protein VIU61_11295 [Kofleriaceae bacterium]
MTTEAVASKMRGLKEIDMGRGDNRQTPKMKRKRSQAKLKARIKRKIAAGKAAKKPTAPSKKK